MKRVAVLPGARLLLAVVAAGIAAASASGAPTGVPAWERTFRRNLTGAGNQKPVAARELADGSRMVVVNDNAGVSCVRYDAAGAVLSTATFYPAEDSPYYGAALAAIDAFGGVFVVVEADRNNLNYRGDIWTMKFDGLTGRELWPSAQTYTSPGFWRDEPQRCAIDPYGDVIVMGVTYENSSQIYQVVLKYDGTTGLPSWDPIVEQTFTGTSTVDEAGDVYVSGSGAGNLTSKYSGMTGALVWSSPLLQLSYPQIARVGAGRLVVSGANYVGAAGLLQTESYDAATGALLWSQSYGDPNGNDHLYLIDLAVGAAGQAFLLGQTTLSQQFFTIERSAADGALEWGPVDVATSNLLPGFGSLRLTAGGDVLGTVVVYDYPDQSVQSWRQAESSGAVSWGPIATPNASCCDLFAWFVASDGRIFYSLALFNQSQTDLDAVSFERDADSGQVAGSTQTFTGAAGGTARLNDLTLDPAGDVIVTGNAIGADGTAPWATIKYDHTTGAAIWGRSFPTNALSGYWPYQVLTDSAGNAIVVGFVELSNSDFRLVVQKYAAADGATLWTNGIVSDFLPYGLAVDAAGNPAVLGQVYSDTGYDTALIKLSGVDGHALWGPVVYDSGDADYPISLAGDGAGDLILTALSYGQSSYSYVLKYSGATGTLLWGPKTLDGARLNFVAVDPTGNPVVTGYQGQEMVTMKYDGGTGAVVWGPVLTSSSGDSASGFWATSDASGNVYVTGPFYIDYGNNDFDYDIALIKFSGADGSILWGPVFFDGPSHLSDWPYSVVLDGSGNPIVAGETEATPRSWRVLALKYDGATGAALWNPVMLEDPASHNLIDGLAARGSSVYLGGVVNNAYATFALVESLGIATEARDLPIATCGQGYSFALAAANGTPAYSWSVVSGALPPGVSLTAAGPLTGTPAAEGGFAFRVQVQDSVGAIAQRDFSITVGAPSFVAINAVTDAACQTTLSVAGSWSAYHWLPGGETTPSIVVAPAQATTYGVLLTDPAGCAVGGEITIPAVVPGQSCTAPVVDSIAPDSGPAAGGTALVVSGSQFQTGAWLVIGSTAATGVSVSSQQISATTPALPAGQVLAVRVTNPGGRSGVLANGFFADFLDLDSLNPFHDYVESIVRAGITAGCGGGNYCATSPITRAQMAVFLLKAEHGGSYVPPPCQGMFADVACPSTFANWIEQLANEGVTGGCGGGNYCPTNGVTRSQMAVFLLKTSQGSSYVPPPATGTVFADVPASAFAADWIEDLHARNITGGCLTNPLRYCPSNINNRQQMAVFITKTFGLP